MLIKHSHFLRSCLLRADVLTVACQNPSLFSMSAY
nr:MAG TPA: hypothetical protein [Caudoviricetes sp.]